jgi:hypothetical protein
MDRRSAADANTDRTAQLEKQEFDRLKAEIKKLEAQLRKAKPLTRRQRAAKARIRARERARFKSRFSTRRSFTGRPGSDRPCQGGLCNGR